MVAEIGDGLLVLVGVTHTDTATQSVALARKIARLRILPGERSVDEQPDASVLVVSQFTLYGDARKGRRPSWSAAAPAATAAPLVDACVAALREFGVSVRTGIFGSDMRISLVNEGPMTVLLEVCVQSEGAPRDRWSGNTEGPSVR